ncbi:MAG: hypothetical protein FJX64_09745 [Alphaproteobacteria bacterium]|nr:hypothetical protein [Alphaproteobacteria bacterium]
MQYDPEQAMKWRLRAEMLRTRADATTNPVAKASFLALANTWDEKAAQAEKPRYLNPLPPKPE